MFFKEVPIKGEFVVGGVLFRKCSETKAHNLTNHRDGAGPTRFRPDDIVEPAPAQLVAEAAAAEQLKAAQEAAAAKETAAIVKKSLKS